MGMTALFDALNSHHTLWEWLIPWTSNPIGIDLPQDVTVTCHSSYTMLTETSGSDIGAPYLTISSMKHTRTERKASLYSSIFLLFCIRRKYWLSENLRHTVLNGFVCFEMPFYKISVSLSVCDKNFVAAETKKLIDGIV